MKKLAVISLISLLLIGGRANAEIRRNANFYEGNELEAAQEEFFETGIMTPVRPNNELIHTNEEFDSFLVGVSGGDAPKTKGMPLFKKYRIKLTNYYRTKAYEEAQRLLKEEEEFRAKYSESFVDIDDEELQELTNRSVKKVYKTEDGDEVQVSALERFKNVFKRNKDKVVAPETRVTETGEEPSEKQLELTGGVKEVVAQKDIILDCDKMNYDEQTSELEATGNPVLSFPPQGVTIKADKLVYNTASNVIKAFGNVEIIKDKSSVFGDYIQINLNEETALVSNMNTSKMNMLVNAKNVIAEEDTIILEDGTLQGDKHYMLALRSRMIGPRLEHMMVNDEDRSSITNGEGLQVNIKAEEIYVTAKKDHDIVQVKNVDVYFHDNHLFRLENLVAHTNKNNEYFEANYPELGSKPRIGMYIGPGYVFDSPIGGGTLKVVPFLNYKNKIGVGAALKYRSGTNFTEAYYGSAKDTFVLKGRQFLDDRLYLQYGVNAYLENWWMGSGMSKYQIEAIYRDSATIPNVLGDGKSATFRQRISAGYLQDSDYNRRNEDLGSNEMGTGRLKYMAELSQSLLNYKNKDKLLQANLSWMFQGSAAVYGTGDTQFIGRTGPMLHTQYKYWMQDLGYFLSTFEDNTPVPVADTYRYGRSSIFLRESLRMNKYLALSWLMFANLSNDSPNNKTLQENGFYLAIGPDDLKLMLGYDFIREQTVFLFTTNLDMKGTKVDYKKMVIKNPERLSQDESEKVELVNYDKPKQGRVKRTYAQVIEIEDPDREQIQ